MKTLCIVPCGKRKIWDKIPDAGPQKAKDVYIGPYASKCIQYAQVFHPDSWCILSAKYGFLLPNDIIAGPYNITFKDNNTNPISINELFIQVQERKLYDFDEIIVLGGKIYCDIVDYVFKGKNISKPLNGSRLGEALRKLNEDINTGISL